MGPFPQIMLAALVLAAFALASQQRLAIASHTGPAPARQIAYLMRSYHSSAVANKLGATSATPPTETTTITGFVSCADAQNVVTTVDQSHGTYDTARTEQIVGELLRQSSAPPEFGNAIRPGIGVPGIGLSNGTQIQTGLGMVALPPTCPVPAGLPAILTQVVP